jgi:RNase P/RNase MRP subunit POP5
MVGTKDTTKNSYTSKTRMQKVLLPTLKDSQRYLVYKLVFKGKNADKNIDNNIDNKNNNSSENFGAIHNNIILQCSNMLGIFDSAKAGLMSAKYNPDTMSGIIRVNNKYVDKLKVCLGMIKNVNGKELIVDCIYVSGMLNKAVEKINN